MWKVMQRVFMFVNVMVDIDKCRGTNQSQTLFKCISDIQYLRETLPSSIESEFFDYLKNLTAKDVTVYAIEEGSVVFPR